MRRTAPLGERDDLDDVQVAGVYECEDVTGFYLVAGFKYLLAIDADVAGLDEARGQRAGSNQAGMPQPLVDALTGCGLRHDLSVNSAFNEFSTANGESSGLIVGLAGLAGLADLGRA